MGLYQTFARFAGAVSSLLGCIVLLGWQFDVASVKSLLPGFVTMKANTALCFLLAGVSLWILSTQMGRSQLRWNVIARICAVTVLLIALLTITEDIFDFNAGIDDWMPPGKISNNEGSPQYRMSGATAASFMILGATLLLLSHQRRRSQETAQHLALVVVWIAFVALVGYAYGTLAPFGGAPLPVASFAFASMAVHTSLGFALLGLGAFVVRSECGLMATISSPYLGGFMARRVLPLTVLVASCLFWLGIVGRQSETYDVGFLLTILAIGIVSVLALTVWLSARSLNRLDAQRIQSEEQIRNSLREKEVLLKEIHHRVKNNLQMVSSMLGLQSRHVASEETRKVFNESRLRIHTMALIHEQLYKSPDLSQVKFADYLQELVAHVLRSHAGPANTVSSRINVQDVQLPVDVAIPCALIVNELVSNSLKHAFPNGGTGEICIDLRQTSDQQARLFVADTGVGFPPHVNPDETPTLGLRLVRTLAEQLGGRAEFSKQGGAEVEVIFQSGL